jgi:hypothetical protein
MPGLLIAFSLSFLDSHKSQVPRLKIIAKYSLILLAKFLPDLGQLIFENGCSFRIKTYGTSHRIPYKPLLNPDMLWGSPLLPSVICEKRLFACYDQIPEKEGSRTEPSPS